VVAGESEAKVAEINDGCDGHGIHQRTNQETAGILDPGGDRFKEVNELGNAIMDWDKEWHLPAR